MKRALVFLCAVCAATISYAVIGQTHFAPARSAKEANVTFIKMDGLKKTKVPKAAQEQADVTQAYTMQEGDVSGQLRYTLFADTGSEEETFEEEFLMYSLAVAANILEIDPYEVYQGLTFFNPADAQKEFNADIGWNFVKRSPSSAFTEGFDIVSLEAFAKAGSGIVMRTWLCNDVAFFGINREQPEETTQEDIEASLNSRYYHSFVFKD